jgi:hypothetical protein
MQALSHQYLACQDDRTGHINLTDPQQASWADACCRIPKKDYGLPRLYKVGMPKIL